MKGILLDEAGDLQITVKRDSEGKIVSGLVIGDSSLQNQYVILAAQKGEFKEYPTLGVGISDMLGDDDVLEWKKRIREEFAKDELGINSIDLDLQSGRLNIDAKYKK